MVDISVIVPSYNIESKIERCINSLLEQTWKSYEIIIVNDCSTDNTLDICRNYEKDYSQVKVVNHIKNKGLPSARNSGVNAAIGEFIWHVDGDDYIYEKDAIRKILEKLRADGTSVIKFGMFHKTKDKFCRVNPYNNDLVHSNTLLSKGTHAVFTYAYSRMLSKELNLFF